jgi:hypothetical protein
MKVTVRSVWNRRLDRHWKSFWIKVCAFRFMPLPVNVLHATICCAERTPFFVAAIP